MSRYGFKTSLTRSISSYNAAKKRKQREELIEIEASKKTKAGPYFYLVDFDFNENNRTTHITFKQLDMYRKIERYVTSNYVRTPIYSENWYKKEKLIKKTIKLTNKELEQLEYNPDELIRRFKYEIIDNLQNEDLIPSWAAKFALDKKKNELISAEKENLDFSIDQINKGTKQLTESKDKLLNENKKIGDSLVKIRHTVLKKTKKANRKKNVLLSIITFGIYGYLTSNKYKTKMFKSINSLNELINNYENTIKENAEKITSTNKEIDNNNHEINRLVDLHNKNCEAIELKYQKYISEVEPLDNDINKDDAFIPLKKLIGIEYRKIVGCYVIHNKEKDKYYVGQSKDVLKRVLRDHFNGTEVKNIIFAEDYYTSKLEDKSELFEVKIIECETKDELDRTEKELIESYDSFRNGYNGTGGNN